MGAAYSVHENKLVTIILAQLSLELGCLEPEREARLWMY